MKFKLVFSIRTRVLAERDRIAISVPDYKFLSEWEPGIFGELCKKESIFSFYHRVEDPASEEIVEAAYFRIPPSISAETVESLSRFMSVRLFVCEPQQDFFEKVPSIVQQAIISRDIEFDEDVILAASSMSGFKWMALRDGDEGDAYYYLFENE